jgi:hypothetical protein
MMMACFKEDEESQKKGFVCVYFAFGQTKVRLSRTVAYNKVSRSLPVKVVATHVCRHDDNNGSLFKAAIKQITEIMEANRLCRWRSHVGK